MELYAKSALSKTNIQDKINRGADGIEIQLLDELFSMTADELFERSKDFIIDAPIKVVHAPLIENGDINVEYAESYEVLKRTCRLAQLIAEEKGEDIVTVIHVATTVDRLKRLGIYDRVKNTLMTFIEDNPNIIIGIENVTSVSFDGNKISFDDSYIINNGHITTANVLLVNELNNDRIMCVIDFCHAMMTKKFFAAMNFYLDHDLNVNNIVQDIFDSAREKTILYHLAKAEGSGYSDDEVVRHSCPFSIHNSYETALLKEFLENYNRAISYNNRKNIPVTIEVYENDYTNSHNFSMTKEAIEILYNNNSI